MTAPSLSPFVLTLGVLGLALGVLLAAGLFGVSRFWAALFPRDDEDEHPTFDLRRRPRAHRRERATPPARRGSPPRKPS